MTASASSMERLVTLLGGWPEHFEEEERKHGEKAMPTAAQQAVRAARDRKYYQWCAAEELCVAMWVFLWRSVHTASGWLTGVEDQREVLLPALVEMGTAIKNRSVEMQ